MPATNTPSKSEIKFAVPPRLLELALEIAKFEGWTSAEFHRLLWDAGLAARIESSNAALKNRMLRQEWREEDGDTTEGAEEVKTLDWGDRPHLP